MAKVPWRRRLRAAIDWKKPEFETMRQLAESSIFRGACGIERYGKPFLTTFPKAAVKAGRHGNFYVLPSHSNTHESPVAVVLVAEPARKKQAPAARVAELGLIFEKEAVIAMPQGIRGAQARVERFRELNPQKAHWANFMLRLVEQHAKECGFAQVKIPVPESMVSYRVPHLTGKRSAEEIRKSMRALIEGVANAMGYKREGNFFVKDL